MWLRKDTTTWARACLAVRLGKLLGRKSRIFRNFTSFEAFRFLSVNDDGDAVTIESLMSCYLQDTSQENDHDDNGYCDKQVVKELAFLVIENISHGASPFC